MTDQYSGQDITVVIPAHNCAAYIADAVASVEAQTHRPAEILIVENASTDSTLDVIKNIRESSQVPIRVVSTQCPGVSNARNLGFSLAETPLIAMLDADDIYSNEFIGLALSAFNLEPELGFFFGNRQSLDDSGKLGERFLENTALTQLNYNEIPGSVRVIRDDLFGTLLSGSFVSCSGTLLKREAAYRAGMFQVGLSSSEDRKFFCSLALRELAGYSLNVTHYYRTHLESRTGRSRWTDIKRNAILALCALRLESKDDNGKSSPDDRIEKAIDEEIKSLLYTGADEGIKEFRKQLYWLNKKGISVGFSPFLLAKAFKNTILAS